MRKSEADNEQERAKIESALATIAEAIKDADDSDGKAAYEQILKQLSNEIANSWLEIIEEDTEGGEEDEYCDDDGDGDADRNDDDDVDDVDDDEVEYYQANLEDLLHWFDNEELPALRARQQVLQAVATERKLAFYDAFDPAALDKLARYESHLDRRFEKKLSMLIKLQELRRKRETST